MKNERLAQYVEDGLPHLRRISKLPEWLAPGVPEVANRLGDETMLRLAEPIGLTGAIKPLLNEAPETDKLPDEIWQEAISRWQVVNQVIPVMMALLRTREKVEAMERRGMAAIRSVSTIRGLVTIAFAAFVPGGGKILDRLAVILGGNPLEPATLLNLYMKALEDRDRDTLAGIEECILRDPAWAEWSNRFIAEGAAFPFSPRAIGISPVPTGELIHLLAAMIVEVTNADRIRNIGN